MCIPVFMFLFTIYYCVSVLVRRLVEERHCLGRDDHSVLGRVLRRRHWQGDDRAGVHEPDAAGEDCAGRRQASWREANRGRRWSGMSPKATGKKSSHRSAIGGSVPPLRLRLRRSAPCTTKQKNACWPFKPPAAPLAQCPAARCCWWERLKTTSSRSKVPPRPTVRWHCGSMLPDAFSPLARSGIFRLEGDPDREAAEDECAWLRDPAGRQGGPLRRHWTEAAAWPAGQRRRASGDVRRGDLRSAEALALFAARVGTLSSFASRPISISARPR